MQCEKGATLQATNDTEHLIADSFMLEGQLTDLYLYPTELKIIQRDKNRTIPLQFALNFSVIEGEHGHAFGLEFFFGEAKIRLERDFWPRGKEWEILLLRYITRKDFHQFFKPQRKIGRGNFATVYLADDLRQNRRVAIKAFMKEAAFKGQGKAAVENQVKLMRRIKNPNCVSLHGVYETKNSLYLSMEYIEGCTLDAFFKRNKYVTIEQRRKILKGLLMGLKELAKGKIVHRDLKPENIIVSENCEDVKILDFGLATDINQPSYIFVRCGTPGFVAPEILKIKDIECVRLGVESDMFSLGAIYHHLIYGCPLFAGKDQTEVLALNRQCKIKVAPKENLAFGEFELLCAMLHYDPSCRTTPENALRSSFMQQKKDVFLRALQPIEVESTDEWIFDES